MQLDELSRICAHLGRAFEQASVAIAAAMVEPLKALMCFYREMEPELRASGFFLDKRQRRRKYRRSARMVG